MVGATDADILGMSAFQRARQMFGRVPVEVARCAWIANRRRTRVWAAVAVLWSLVFAGSLFATGYLQWPMPLAVGLGVGAVYFGIAGLGLAFARRVARAGVWLGPEGIVVRGPFITHTVSFADAEEFVPGLQGGAGNGTPCPTLKRRPGRLVGVWALGRRNIVFRYPRLFGEIQPLCDELNELLEALRSESRSAPAPPGLTAL
jgi:hypothetical protein